MGKKPTVRLFALVLALGLFLVACAGDFASTDDSGESASDVTAGFDDISAPASAEEPEADRATDDVGDSALGDGGVVGAQVPIDLGRDIIFTAEMIISSNNVATASAQATEIIEELGGFLVWPGHGRRAERPLNARVQGPTT